MLIAVYFKFADEDISRSTTGVEGAVTDLILPCPGDTVRHRDRNGQSFIGKVTERIYNYDLPNGVHVDGTVEVTIVLARITTN